MVSECVKTISYQMYNVSFENTSTYQSSTGGRGTHKKLLFIDMSIQKKVLRISNKQEKQGLRTYYIKIRNCSRNCTFHETVLQFIIHTGQISAVQGLTATNRHLAQCESDYKCVILQNYPKGSKLLKYILYSTGPIFEV